MRARLALAAVMLALAACGQAYRLRTLRADEASVLASAADPLLRELGYMRSSNPCRFGTVVNDVEGRQVEVMRSTSTEYCLGFVVTTGALGLPREELRALIAHGLGHVHLNHTTTTGRRVSTRVGRGLSAEGAQARLYTPEEETEADRYAAGLLIAVSPARQGAGCQALAAMLERAGTEGDRWGAWLEQHPPSPGRAAAARGFCGNGR